jgi:prophage antirepressor-like protein
MRRYIDDMTLIYTFPWFRLQDITVVLGRESVQTMMAELTNDRKTSFPQVLVV